MEAKEIYLNIKREVTKGLYVYDDQIAAIAKWVESEFEPKKQGEKLPIHNVSDSDYQEVKTDNSDDNFILKLDYQGVKLLKQALSRTMAKGEVLDFSMKLEDDLYKYMTNFEKR